MNLSNEFNPVPKPSFKKTKSQKERNAISKQEYQRAVEEFGECCVLCKRHPIEMHHVRFRSQGGRGTFRNLIPLCKKHHVMAHTSRPLADQLRENREQKYGKWYGLDRHDLYMHGLIEDSTFESFENFMLREEEKANGTPNENQSNYTNIGGNPFGEGRDIGISDEDFPF